MRRVALVAAPWQRFDRPSIQLASLKAFVQGRIPDVAVEAHHLYLAVAARIGASRYTEIAEWTEWGESLYAVLLFPGMRPTARLLMRRQLGERRFTRLGFDRLTRALAAATNAYVDHVDWGQYGLVGFSICFAQLASSVYCARRIKRRFPGTCVVVGGSGYGRDSLLRILTAFPEFDLAVPGEGELPFADLVAASSEQGADPLRAVPGVVTRDSLPGASTFCRQVASLDELPFPDFRDYFEQLETLVGGKRLYITLPVEGSRGCAWMSPPHVGVPTSAGCAYCALNGIWQGYRRKSAARLAAEVEALSDRHRVLSILFTDTLWPLSPAHRAALARLNKDLRLFAELRPNLGAAAVRDLAHTRSWTIQFGVEALSTPLLRRMNRGVTAIQNLQALKLCEELGVAVTWNLMLEYPSSDAADVEATLRAIEFAWPFKPCNLTTFILQPDSRAAADPRACSIRAVRDHPLLHALFPPKTSRVLRGIFLDFDGRAQQRRLWDPVRRQVALWQREYDRVRGEAAGKPILSYGDGGSFLLIRRLRPGQDPLLYRFGEKSRAVYLFCREHRSLRAIARKFACIEERHLLALLRSMVDQRLMFTEADRYLSLAVHDRDRPGV